VQETSTQRKERQEAELEAEREDTARKLEEEFEEMEGLEERVKRMRERREALRSREALKEVAVVPGEPEGEQSVVNEEDDEEDDYDEEWDGFRLKG